MEETWIQSLDQEDPLEKEMATHFSILAWGTSMDRQQPLEWQRVRHDLGTNQYNSYMQSLSWPTPVIS